MPSSSLPSIIATLGVRSAVRRARLELKQEFVHCHRWFDTHDRCEDECILIGGCGRSGTTVLREMMNRHSRIAVGPETAILCDIPNAKRLSVEWRMPVNEVRRLIDTSDSIVRFAEAFFRRYAKDQGKPRWADKTPRNIRSIGRLLQQFPRCRFIHIIRDGRDVACSLRTHPKTAIRHGKLMPNSVNKPIDECIRRWVEDVSAGLPFQSHSRVLEVRYEDVARDPTSVMKSICNFVGETFEPAMVQGDQSNASLDMRAERLVNNAQAAGPVHTKSISRWQKDLSLDERREIARHAGGLLEALGYASDDSWVDRPTG